MNEKFCPNCEEYRPTRRERRDETYQVRGRAIVVPVDAEVCAHCGQSVGTDEDDERVLAAVYAEYRKANDLLSPADIKGVRLQYGLSQRSFAALLGLSQATINRYERGTIQERSHDELIRACQNPLYIRRLLERRGHLLTEAQRKLIQRSLEGEAGRLDLLSERFVASDALSMPLEVSEKTGYRLFDYKRFSAVVVWFCDHLNSVLLTVLNKLPFYADFLHFKVSTVSMTGAAYRRIQFGPVPADYDGLLSLMEHDGFLQSEEVAIGDYTGKEYSLGPNARSLGVEFTPTELAVLEKVARTLGRLTAKKISERSHLEPAWRNTPDRQLISYREAASLSLSL